MWFDLNIATVEEEAAEKKWKRRKEICEWYSQKGNWDCLAKQCRIKRNKRRCNFIRPNSFLYPKCSHARLVRGKKGWREKIENAYSNWSVHSDNEWTHSPKVEEIVYHPSTEFLINEFSVYTEPTDITQYASNDKYIIHSLSPDQHYGCKMFYRLANEKEKSKIGKELKAIHSNSSNNRQHNHEQ